MAKEWLNSTDESHNPWSSSSAYINLGSLGNIIKLSERIGHTQKEITEIPRKETIHLSPSVKLIAILVDLANLGKALNKVKVLLHHHCLKEETKDVTDVHILEGKTQRMEELSLHLSALVDKKDDLVGRLQQPFVGEYINIDADYHRYVSESVPSLSGVLTNLSNHLDVIKWSGQFSLEDGEMENILGKVSSALAQIQSFHQSLCLSRSFMNKLMETDLE